MFDPGHGPAHASSSAGNEEEEEPWHAGTAEAMASAERSVAARARGKEPPCYAHSVRSGKRQAARALGLVSPVSVTLAASAALAASASLLGACDRDAALDTVADLHADPAIWKADAEKIAGALPRRVGAFAPAEGTDPFHTSYATGPVFGASCVYGDGARQLAVRVESGNVKARAEAALEAHPASPADPKSISHEASVHGRAAVVRYQATARVGEVSFVVARRYLVQVRLVPAASEAEAVAIAEAVDVSALDGLSLQGVTR